MSHQNIDGRIYRPFPVDWRFLPQPALLAKDWLRRRCAQGSNWAAVQPGLRIAWRHTIGRNTLNAVLRAKFLFIHIPKTAGTSISACLYGRNLPPYKAQFYKDAFGDKLIGIPSFAVIRHPLDRLISLYNMAVNGGTEILAYDSISTLEIRAMKSFSDFVDHIHNNRGRLSSLPAIMCDQSGFVQDNRGAVIVDRMFAMDREKGPPEELASWLGVRSLPHLNSRLSHRAILRPGDIEKVKQIYERDFDLYRSLARR